MLPTKYRGLSVCHTLVSPAKTAEPIEMPSGLWALMCPRNSVLDGGPEMLRDVAVATNFGTKIAITGFVWMIATRLLVLKGVWVVGQQNADNADTLQPVKGTLPWQPFFGFLYVGAYWRHLANTTTIHMCEAMRPYVKLLWPLVHLVFCCAIWLLWHLWAAAEKFKEIWQNGPWKFLKFQEILLVFVIENFQQRLFGTSPPNFAPHIHQCQRHHPCNAHYPPANTLAIMLEVGKMRVF